MLILEGNSKGTGWLYEDCQDIKYESIIDEGKEKKCYITGLFSQADVQLRNPRTYRKHILEREVNKFQKLINIKKSWGELGHPKDLDLQWERLSHVITELSWQGNILYGKALILPTPKGDLLKAVAEESVPGVSSRGSGTVLSDGYVDEDYNLITWDAVLRPSADSAIRLIREQQDLMLTNNVSEEDLEKFIKDLNNNKFRRKQFDKQIIERFKNILNINKIKR